MYKPTLVESTNLSDAWLQALSHVNNNPGYEISPLIASITDFHESLEFRAGLDSSLTSKGLATVETVSETIFPESLYKYCNKDRLALYAEYLKNLPRIKAIAKQGNGRGTYFERLIAFENKNNQEPINQIEIIIKSLESNTVKRRSKLQASLFDPTRDHSNGAFQGFPCLQQVTFYKSQSKGLIINSFYAIQYLHQRAYGNWLGLINLGKFVANELDIELERFNCFIGVEKLATLKKVTSRNLEANLKKITLVK